MAGEKRAKLIIELQDLATAGLDKLRDGISFLSEHVLGLSLSFAGLVAAATEALKAFGEMQEATDRLNGALRSQGLYTDAYADSLQNLAKHIQDTTTFSRQSALETFTMLTRFGLAGAEMEKATMAAMGFSKAMRIDLNTAVMLVARAYEGHTQMLARYNITIDQSADRGTRFNQTLAEMNRLAGSALKDSLDGINGQVEQAKNRFHDLTVEIGQNLLPVANKLLGWANTAIEDFGYFLKGLQTTQLQDLQQQLKAVNKELQFHNTLMSFRDMLNPEMATAKQNELLKKQADIIKQINDLKKKQHEEDLKPRGGAPGSKPPPSLVTSEELAALNLKIAKGQGMGPGGLLENKVKTDKMEIDMEVKKAAKIFDIHKQAELRDALTLQKRRENFASTLSFISTLANSKNKELAAIGKAASIADATMKTYQAANVALASAPPPVNYILAGAVTAAGLANVATIAGIQLAEGGMVMPTSGGTLATMGEAGSREVAIPLDDPRTIAALREALGGGMGGGVTVHVGTLIADQAGLEDFARRLDQVFWRLKKNRQTVAI